MTPSNPGPTRPDHDGPDFHHPRGLTLGVEHVGAGFLQSGVENRRRAARTGRRHLLDSYSAERAPVAKRIVMRANNSARGIMSTATDELQAVVSDEVVVSEEQAAREAELTARVVASFDECGNPRLRELMTRLFRHLHEYIRELRLTEAEWSDPISFLTWCGHITDDKRQEFVRLSDVLGASMQTIAVNNEAYGEATVFGPFFVEGSPQLEPGGDIAAGAVGELCWVEGSVTDASGKPLPGALIEVWEADDDDDFYDVQYWDDRTAGRAHPNATTREGSDSGPSHPRRTPSRTTVR